MGYYEYFAKVAKADAKKACAEAVARKADAEARKARRFAIQPQMDELSKELDAAAASGASVSAINEIGKRIDDLLASIN